MFRDVYAEDHPDIERQRTAYATYVEGFEDSDAVAQGKEK